MDLGLSDHEINFNEVRELTTAKEAAFQVLKSDFEKGGFTKLINSFLINGYYPEDITPEILINLSIHPSFRKYPELYVRWAKEQNNKKREKDQASIKVTVEKTVEFIPELSTEEEKALIEKLRESFKLIKQVMQTYIKLKEEYYNLIALWILGTYFHGEFQAYPYLFLNAMKGSGKSRSMNLIVYLSYQGAVMISPTEAVLFRTTGTLGIDEFEGVATKEKSAIRELLNASYKKGIKVMRMKKRKTPQGEEQVVDEFEPYRPIVIANIWGMDEVLGDRCITVPLDKSNDNVVTKLIEDFENDQTIKNIKNTFDLLFGSDKRCRLCSVCSLKNINIHWNTYIINKYTTPTLHTLHTLHTQPTQPTQTINTTKNNALFKKIDESGIYGRQLELFMPLFFLANFLDDSVLVDQIISIARDIVFEKKQEEQIESYDVQVIDFIATLESSLQFFSVKELTQTFRESYDLSKEWITPEWFSRALKRLGLIVQKRRVRKGIELIPNVPKAKEKIKMFRPTEK